MSKAKDCVFFRNCNCYKYDNDIDDGDGDDDDKAPQESSAP